jgi:high-affinity K+ transport system ATPase subunit B
MKQRKIISIVNEGERIPFDGKVCEGLALVDESAETGVSTSQIKEEGQEVLAGSLVMQGWLKIESPLDAKCSNKAKEAPAQFALLGIALTLIGMTLAILFASIA